MNSKIKYKKELEPDALDVRVNRLIARYSNVCELIDEVHDSRTNRNYCRKSSKINTLTCSEKTSTVHTYPINNEDYFYKLRDPSDSSEKKGGDKALINCHNIYYYYSSNSDDTDVDSSLSTTTYTRANEENTDKPNSKVQFQDNCKNANVQTSFINESLFNKSYAEKTTYCRPLKNSYDNNFVFKVMDRNVKLQRLLTKYVICRQKEKEQEKWKNYVKMMNMNNECFRNSTTSSTKHVSLPPLSNKSQNPILSNDCYEAKKNLQHSDSYREMMHDLYETRGKGYTDYLTEYDKRKPIYDSSIRLHISKQDNFPVESELRRKFENREHIYSPPPHHKTDYDSKIVTENFLKANPSKRIQYFKQIPSHSFLNVKRSKDAQTNITFGSYNTASYSANELESEAQSPRQDLNAMIKDISGLENPATIRENQASIESVQTFREMNNVIKPSIQDIEEKLGTLINLFNVFLSDAKLKKSLDETKSNDTFVISNVEDKRLSTNIESSKSEKPKKRVSIVGDATTSTSLGTLQTNLTPSHYLLNMRLDKILHEEQDKSNKIRSEINGMLNTTNRSTVEVNVEIPTRERSTEVTESLSKTKFKPQTEGVLMEDISYRQIPPIRADRRIAVNTEPLGFLTLLRLSTEAVKQILSFIPDISWYLTKMSRPVHNTDYVCNICGASFARPSQLGAHILCHDLGTRDCTVCHHTVDSRRPSRLFCCKHCGKRFTRAYCCELHQQTCGHGHSLDHKPSIALLR